MHSVLTTVTSDYQKKQTFDKKSVRHGPLSLRHMSLFTLYFPVSFGAAHDQDHMIKIKNRVC